MKYRITEDFNKKNFEMTEVITFIFREITSRYLAIKVVIRATIQVVSINL